MKVQSILLLTLCLFSAIASYGCAVLQGISAGQTWSENYALAVGVQANDPAIIDGDVNTVGQSQYIEGSGEQIQDLSAPSESVILLPEPKSIHRVMIHSTNLEAFDLWVTDDQGRWEKIKEVKNNKAPVVDLRLRQTVNTAGVKIRVRRTSDDAGMRRENVRNIGGYRLYSGRTRAQAKIAEIELYGFAPTDDKVDEPSQTSQGDNGGAPPTDF